MSVRTTSIAAALAATTLSLFSATAHAQYAAPPPVYGQPQPVYAQQQPVVYQQPPRRLGRFRYGGDVGGGWAFLGPLSGAGITASLRLGWQIDDNWAAYYQGDLPIAFAAGDYAGFSYGGAAIVLGTGLMGEYTLGDILSFGLGPSLDYAAAAICASGSGSTCIGEGGTYFGIQARVMVTLLASTSGAESRRRGLRVGVSSHTTFMGDVLQTFNLHLGYEYY